ncbi:unnamed protein product [Choristocarpus tenellus]
MKSDGTDAGPFSPGESLLAETGGQEENGGGSFGESYREMTMLGTAMTSGMEWQEYADDNGLPYWYNAMTGTSQYENPHLLNDGSDSTSADTYLGLASATDGDSWNATSSSHLTQTGDSNNGTDEWSQHYDDNGYPFW